jgi:hypothetical protein
MESIEILDIYDGKQNSGAGQIAFVLFLRKQGTEVIYWLLFHLS